MGFERMWRDLAPVGRSATTGGYDRLPWASAERECAAWFREEALHRGLDLVEDALGNVVAWWRPADQPPGTPVRDGVLTGSHLDSVADGGAYDGPLGVVSALAAVDLLRERGVVPDRPIGVGTFVEEEGSRFGVACLGSRLAAGTLTWDDVRSRRDRDGVALEDVAAPPSSPGVGDAAGTGVLAGVATFVELHVEQGRALVDLGRAVGVGTGIWPHGRWRLEVTGRADHAGTTRMEDRADPLLTASMVVLAANKQARLSGGRARATVGRLEVEPGAANAVPARVQAWLDARAESVEDLEALVAAVARQAHDRAERDGTAVEVTAESTSPEVAFDADLARLLASDHEGGALPLLPTQAGHDAGALAEAGLPTAMLFVRNPTGTSHSPAEHAEVADCLAGVAALADSLERLASA